MNEKYESPEVTVLRLGLDDIIMTEDCEENTDVEPGLESVIDD